MGYENGQGLWHSQRIYCREDEDIVRCDCGVWGGKEKMGLLDDIYKKRFENDLEANKKKLIALKKFAGFLDEFEKNPNNYRKIVVDIDHFEPRYTCEQIEFNSDEIVKEHWNNITPFWEGCDIIKYDDDYIATTFYFCDDRKLVSIFCFKAGKEKKG